MRYLALTTVCLLAAGCVTDDEDPANEDAQTSADGRVISDEGVAPADAAVDVGDEADAEPTPDVGSEADDGVADVGADDAGAEPDAFMGTTIESCEEACGRYAACERLGEVFGDEDACLSRCARLTRGDAVPENWWSCLEVEQCRLLHLCRPPEPEPIGCEELCQRADACDVAFPGCLEACQGDEEDAFRRCGESLVDACGAEAFVECLGREIYPSCQNTCARGVACNVVREEGCLLECVAGVADADPLFSLRAAQRNACVNLANQNCEAVAVCFDPPEPGEEPVVTEEAFCQRYRGCGFDDFIPCEQLVRDFGERNPEFLRCGFNLLQPCPQEPFQILEICLEGGGGPDPRVQQCNRFCEAQRVCGRLDDDPLGQVNCVNDCSGGRDADPDEVERAAATLPCVVADRCPDLDECIEQSGPAVECREHCAALAECELGFEDCEAACDTRWARDRHQAYRACVAEAEGCDAVGACEEAPGAPCPAYCERAVECGLEPANRCAARCDDAHFADPAGRLLLNACVIAAPECRADDGNDPSAVTCQRRPTDGLACLGYCRHLTECVGEGDLGACLAECGQGFVGDDGLAFLTARDCLRELDAEAECAALDACVPDALEADCPAFCANARGCGVELADCEAACGEDPLSRLRVLQRGDCLTEAGDDCEAVRACLVPGVRGPDPDVVRPIDQQTFCDTWNECGYDRQFGPCEIVIQEFGADDAALRCIYDQIVGICPQDFERFIFECIEGGQPAGSPIAEECASLCEARAFCDDDEARDQAACRRACERRINPNEPDAVARILPRLACAGAWSCPDLELCLDASTPAAICEAQCARRIECGAEVDAAVCEAACDADFARLRQFDYRGCLDRAVDCDGVNACQPAPGVPCAEACAARGECGRVEPGCAAVCDDAHFADPLPVALEVACVLAADGECDGEGGIAGCAEDPGPGARACLGYCRALTECADEPEQPLVDCLNACVAGFDDASGLRFAAARACLEEVAPDAECPALTACLPAEVAVNCDAHCAELDACRVPAEDCAAACAGGAVDLDTGGCVADARRAGGGCAAVAACVGYAPPRATPECVRACGLRNGCDRAVDPYLCRLDCTPPDDALPVQLACAELVDCGAPLNACFELAADLNDDCVDACADAAVCPQFADDAACAARCTGQIASELPRDGWADAIGECLGEAIDGDACDRDAADACFQVGIRLGFNQGFGHHGNCETFNQCGDAQTCADAACAFHGHGDALSWESGLCMDLAMNLPGGMDCDLFNQIPNNLDENWPGFCNIPVAYDVLCAP